jgi:hypothetical protein
VECYGGLVALEFFAERIRQPCEAADVHPHRKILASDVRRANLAFVGWGALTTDFRMTVGSDRRLQMLREPHVAKNAAIVEGLLEELALADTRLGGDIRVANSDAFTRAVSRRVL